MKASIITGDWSADRRLELELVLWLSCDLGVVGVYAWGVTVVTGVTTLSFKALVLLHSPVTADTVLKKGRSTPRAGIYHVRQCVKPTTCRLVRF